VIAWLAGEEDRVAAEERGAGCDVQVMITAPKEDENMGPPKMD